MKTEKKLQQLQSIKPNFGAGDFRHETAAKTLFRAYNETGKRWRTHDGKPVPPWESLGEEVRQKWLTVGARAIAEVDYAANHTARVLSRRVLVSSLIIGFALSILFSAVASYFFGAHFTFNR